MFRFNNDPRYFNSSFFLSIGGYFERRIRTCRTDNCRRPCIKDWWFISPVLSTLSTRKCSTKTKTSDDTSKSLRVITAATTTTTTMSVNGADRKIHHQGSCAKFPSPDKIGVHSDSDEPLGTAARRDGPASSVSKCREHYEVQKEGRGGGSCDGPREKEGGTEDRWYGKDGPQKWKETKPRAAYIYYIYVRVCTLHPYI